MRWWRCDRSVEGDGIEGVIDRLMTAASTSRADMAECRPVSDVWTGQRTATASPCRPLSRCDGQSRAVAEATEEDWRRRRQ